MRWGLLLLIGALAAPSFAGPDLDALRASVIQVYVVSQEEDYSRPWQRPDPQSWSGTAFNIGDRRLLTNAHNIAGVRNLLVKRADRVKRYEARVLFAGHDCDLAMLTVDDDSFWEGMVPLEIGTRPEMRSTVAAVGYPTGGVKLSITEGVVSRIEVQSYSHTRGDAHLAIQIDAAINPGNSGGPVMQGDKVVGVAFQGQFFSQSIGYMIPPSVMRHFLRDVEDGVYDGYPEIGLETASLENDNLRSWLGVPAEDTGVVVLKAVPYASCVGLVQRNDVVHAIDGVPIENDGTIRVGDEFYDFTLLVEDKQVGESVTLTLRRGGERVDVPVPLKKWGARMKLSEAHDERPEYLVTGGYVFLPLSLNYLMRSRGSEELIYYMQQYYKTVAEEGKSREQLVLLSQVLPHPSTRYRDYSNAIVATVDGVVPKDFAHFVKLLDGAQGRFVPIEFEGVNVAPLILDREVIAKVNDEILKRYGIREDRHVAGEDR